MSSSDSIFLEFKPYGLLNMKELTEFFSTLLRTDKWPARWYCGKWTEFHGWLYIVSDLMIWASYFLIPLVLLYFVIKRRDDLPFLKLFWLFILFILSCGLTHLVDAMMFWYPAYQFSAVVLLITALISWTALIALVKILPVALSLKSPTDMSRMVEEKTHELKEANEGLKRLNADLDSFIYSASHDLKSPASNIEGLVKLLRMELNGQATPKINDVLAHIESTTSRIKKTISSMSEVAKVQRNPYEDVMDIVISAVIEEVLNENAYLLAERKITFQYNLSVEKVNYSYTAFKSVLYNLITNAIKYSDPEKEAEIRISCYMEMGNPVFIVEDNGLGIDLKENAGKIFVLFKRFHDHIEGTGIGLYIIKKIVESKGGRIEVESELRKGSRFKVFL